MAFNDVGEGFIPSVGDRFYGTEISMTLKLSNGCLIRISGGDKPLPYGNCKVIDYY